MTVCDNCRGTGHERVYEPWEDCPDCDGTGYLWAEPDDTEDRLAEENRARLFGRLRP